MSDTARYLARRERRFLKGFLKRLLEWRAIRRCLAAAGDLKEVCDVPCGPGRLFPLWHARGLRIRGVDLSRPFLREAKARAEDLGADADLSHGDAFRLSEVLGRPADLVASVRFIYYFDHPTRVRLLRTLSRASRGFLLLQYKTLDTPKGRRNLDLTRGSGREAGRRWAKHYCTAADIARDLRAAELEEVRRSTIAFSSDKVFVLARRVR
jgi:SAM-dependent methyltransferase